jgi:hypothetical protein
LSCRNVDSATCNIFQINAVACSTSLNRLAAVVRNRTVAKGDSTTLEILRCGQFTGELAKRHEPFQEVYSNSVEIESSSNPLLDDECRFSLAPPTTPWPLASVWYSILRKNEPGIERRNRRNPRYY